MTIFPPIVDGGMVEQSMKTHLQRWLPSYLSEVDSQAHPALARGTTALPRAWDVVPVLDLSEEPQMPAVFIESPGIMSQPLTEGDGRVRAVWEINVIPVVMAKDAISTNALLKRYCAAIRAVVLFKRSLGDPNVRGTDFNGEDYVELPADERRTKQAARVRFSVEYQYIASTKKGPSEPIVTPDPYANPPVDPTAPFPDWGKIPDSSHIGVTIKKKP